MCGGTFQPEDGNLYRAFVPPSEELVARTRAIEASMAAIQKWDGHLPSVTGSGAIPFIDAKSYLK